MLYQAYFMLKNFLGKFSQEEGQGLVEYALILVFIAIVVLVVLGPLGDQIALIFTQIKESLATGAAGG